MTALGEGFRSFEGSGRGPKEFNSFFRALARGGSGIANSPLHVRSRENVQGRGPRGGRWPHQSKS